jgi:hypothetical protein
MLACVCVCMDIRTRLLYLCVGLVKRDRANPDKASAVKDQKRKREKLKRARAAASSRADEREWRGAGPDVTVHCAKRSDSYYSVLAMHTAAVAATTC